MPNTELGQYDIENPDVPNAYFPSPKAKLSSGDVHSHDVPNRSPLDLILERFALEFVNPEAVLRSCAQCLLQPSTLKKHHTCASEALRTLPSLGPILIVPESQITRIRILRLEP